MIKGKKKTGIFFMVIYMYGQNCDCIVYKVDFYARVSKDVGILFYRCPSVCLSVLTSPTLWG